MPHWKSKSAVDIQKLDDDLTLFSTIDPISQRGKRYYAYLLRTSRGNVLLHAPDSPAFYQRHGAAIDALGGVQFLFLTHDGDDSDQTDVVLRRWNAQLCAHHLDLEKLARQKGRAQPPAGFDGDHPFAEGVCVLHLPGHSAGYSALLRQRGDTIQLFSGHLLIEGPHGWRAAQAYTLYDAAQESLRRLKTVAFNELLPDRAWLDVGPQALPPIRLGESDRLAALDEALDRHKPYKPRPSVAKYRWMRTLKL